MMDDSDSGSFAFLMEASGASIQDVALALEKSGGNTQKALERLTTRSGGAAVPTKTHPLSLVAKPLLQ
jgi:translation elongation factor EF-Ts